MNQLYPNARELFLIGNIDWVTDTLAFALYDIGGVFDSDDEILTDVSGVQIALSTMLLGKTATDGYAYADPYSFVGLTHASTVANALIYRTSDSKLIAHLDTVDNMPFEPVGGTYIIKGNGLNGSIFRL